MGRYLGKVMVAGPNPAEGSKLKISFSKMHIYAYAHSIIAMTKVISLSEKAYQTLKGMKKTGESFSDVVLRVADKEKKRSIMEFAGCWKGDDVDEVLADSNER